MLLMFLMLLMIMIAVVVDVAAVGVVRIVDNVVEALPTNNSLLIARSTNFKYKIGVVNFKVMLSLV